MRICCIAEALTLTALTSMPLTTTVTPPLPIAPASRNCDIVATRSLSKTGRLLSRSWSTVMASTLLPAVARTSVGALLTVISCVSAARSRTSRCGGGARVPRRSVTVAGRNPS